MRYRSIIPISTWASGSLRAVFLSFFCFPGLAYAQVDLDCEQPNVACFENIEAIEPNYGSSSVEGVIFEVLKVRFFKTGHHLWNWTCKNRDARITGTVVSDHGEKRNVSNPLNSKDHESCKSGKSDIGSPFKLGDREAETIELTFEPKSGGLVTVQFFDEFKRNVAYFEVTLP